MAGNGGQFSLNAPIHFRSLLDEGEGADPALLPRARKPLEKFLIRPSYLARVSRWRNSEYSEEPRPDGVRHQRRPRGLQEGTLMHEIGHLLNLQHGGPRYKLSAPEITLDSAAQNCIPIHPSVMSYTGQMATYKGANWVLDYSARDGDKLAEDVSAVDGTDELAGIVLSVSLPMPVAYYKFEDNLLDSSGNGNDFTVTGVTTFVAETIDGKAFSFDGATHIVTDDAPFDFDKADPFSIATWFKTSTTGVNEFIFGKTSGAKGYQMLLFNDDEIRLRISNSVGNRILMSTVGADVRDGNWHHIALTYDGSSSASGVTIYIDGAQATTTTINDTLSSSILHNNKLVVGNQQESATSYFTGQMDNVQVYGFELTDVQVNILFDTFS